MHIFGLAFEGLIRGVCAGNFKGGRSMTVDNETESTKAIAAVVNSKAAEKLSGAVYGLVQLGHKIVD